MQMHVQGALLTSREETKHIVMRMNYECPASCSFSSWPPVIDQSTSFIHSFDQVLQRKFDEWGYTSTFYSVLRYVCTLQEKQRFALDLQGRTQAVYERERESSFSSFWWFWCRIFFLKEPPLSKTVLWLQTSAASCCHEPMWKYSTGIDHHPVLDTSGKNEEKLE